jgi:NAD kinase
MIRKAIIHHNASKKAARILKEEVKALLHKMGIQTADRQDKTLSRWGETKIPHITYSDRFGKVSFSMGSDAKRLMAFKDLFGRKKADLLITIGGDGTLLFYKGLYNLPVFSIGSHTSFLCQATGENWRERLLRVLKKQKKETHPMLEAKFGKYKTEPAMNEVCMKNPRHRMLRFLLSVGGKEYKFGADGVIFSTAIGSTGYAYSAGGKEFSKKGYYEIVPVAPHRRRFKPMLVSAGVPSYLKIISRYRHDVVDVVVDGQIIYEMGLNASLRIMKSNRTVTMLR